MTTQRREPRRRLDLAGLFLALVGLASALFCYWLIEARSFNVLVIIPSIVALWSGLRHLIKYEAPHQ